MPRRSDDGAGDEARDAKLTRFVRRPAGPDDMAKAGQHADRIRALRAVGLSDSQIGRALNLKIEAVGSVRGAPSAGATADRPRPTSETSTAIREDLLELLGGGSESRTEAKRVLDSLAERELTSMMSERLKLDLEAKRLEIAERRKALEGGTTGHGGGTGAGDLVTVLLPNGRTVRTTEADADGLRASFARAERDDEVSRLRSELQAEKDRNRDQAWDRKFDAMQQRHTEEMRSLEGRLKPHLTAESIALDAEARAVGLKYDTQGRLMGTVADRADKAPTLLQLANTPRGKRLLEIADRRIERLQQEEGVPHQGEGDTGGEWVEPTDAKLQQAAALLERAASADEVPPPVVSRSPRVTMPGSRPQEEGQAGGTNDGIGIG